MVLAENLGSMKCEVGWFRSQRAHLQLAQMGLIAWEDGVRGVTLKSSILIDLFQAYVTTATHGASRAS